MLSAATDTSEDLILLVSGKQSVLPATADCYLSLIVKLLESSDSIMDPILWYICSEFC